MSVSDVLRVAASQIGYVAPTSDGSRYGKWYAAKYGAYYGGAGVPYCAMFVSWVYDQCPNDSIPGGPKAYVPYFIAAARDAGRVGSFDSAEPGDLICFDWGADGVADHVGIVEGRPEGNSIVTIEGNTSSSAAGSQSHGGGVWRRTRYRSQVCAIIKTSHKTNPTPNNTTLEVVTKMKATHIVFVHNGAICVANVLAGTWRRMHNSSEYRDTLTVLGRSGAVVKRWGELGAKTDEVENTAAFGVEL